MNDVTVAASSFDRPPRRPPARRAYPTPSRPRRITTHLVHPFSLIRSPSQRPDQEVPLRMLIGRPSLGATSCCRSRHLTTVGTGWSSSGPPTRASDRGPLPAAVEANSLSYERSPSRGWPACGCPLVAKEGRRLARGGEPDVAAFGAASVAARPMVLLIGDVALAHAIRASATERKCKMACMPPGHVALHSCAYERPGHVSRAVSLLMPASPTAERRSLRREPIVARTWRCTASPPRQPGPHRKPGVSRSERDET